MFSGCEVTTLSHLCVCVGLGGLSVSIEGASKADIECTDCGSGRCSVTYHPTAPGLYVINILFAEQPVQGTLHAPVCHCDVDHLHNLCYDVV